MKLSEMLRKVYSVLFFIFLSGMAVGCSTVTKRTYPKVLSSEFTSTNKNGSVLVRVLVFPKVEQAYYIRSDIEKSVSDTGVFSTVKCVESLYPSEQIENERKNPGSVTIKNVAVATPEDSGPSTDYLLDFVIIPKKIDLHFFDGTIPSAFTLGIYPAKREFTYETNIRLIQVGGQVLDEVTMEEAFTSEISTVPKDGSHFQVTWEKEPLLNLLAVALKRFQTAGLLK